MTIPENTGDFASEFKDFLDCFVVVGGTPSSLYMEQRIGFNKATKDLDIVILEKGETERSKQFFSKLKKYIEDHGYKSEELKSGKAQAFRFTNPTSGKLVPKEIEIATERQKDISFDRATQRIEEFDMSSIVCEPYIIELLNRYTENFDLGNGVQLPVPKPSLLILMKSYAVLNLEKSENLREKTKAEKHLKDIARLALGLLEGDHIEVMKDAYDHLEDLFKDVDKRFSKERLFSCGWEDADSLIKLEEVIREYIKRV
jgi:hypothetical protein